MTDLVEQRAQSNAARVAVWAFLGFVVYALAAFGSLLLVATVEQVILEPLGLGGEPGTSSWGLVLASHPIAWGVIVAAVAAWFGGRLLPGAFVAGRGSAAHLVAGLALAAVTTYLLHEFVRERYGWSDPDYYGLSIFAPSALVAVALAGWAARRWIADTGAHSSPCRSPRSSASRSRSSRACRAPPMGSVHRARPSRWSS